MYTAYVLTEESRDLLLQKYPATYSKFIGHHVTVDFDVSSDTEIPEEAELKIVGKKDSTDGLETLVVSVNGETQRPDGNFYHVTWSLDPDRYSPKDSKSLLQEALPKYKIVLPILIEAEPELLE